MAELLVTFTEPTRSETGDLYWGRAFGRVGRDGLWDGWIEFMRAGDDVTVTSPRETQQPNRADLVYAICHLLGLRDEPAAASEAITA